MTTWVRCITITAFISAFGYSAIAHADTWRRAGFHGGNTRLYTGDGDWFPGDWKGECGGTTQVASGVSSNLYYGFGQAGCGDGNSYLNNLLCTNDNTANYTYTVNQANGTTLNVWGHNDIRDNSLGDWSAGNYKAVCPAGWIVTGLAQTSQLQNARLAGVRCSATGMSGYKNCAVHSWNEPLGFRGDWDPGWYKMQCNAGEFIKGIAVAPGYGWSDDQCGVNPGTIFSQDIIGILCCVAGP